MNEDRQLQRAAVAMRFARSLLGTTLFLAATTYLVLGIALILSLSTGQPNNIR